MKREEFESILTDDPGNSVLSDYAEYLRQNGKFDVALRALFRGLSANPSAHRARLVLARIFYEIECLPFAIRELVTLHDELPGNRSISKLLDKFGVNTHSVESTQDLNEVASRDSMGAGAEGSSDNDGSAELDETVAEVEFESGSLDLLAQEEENKKE